MKRILHTVAIVLLIASTTSSCEHKEFCEDHSHATGIRVVFDWRNAPGASPASMSLYLFPASGGEALRYDFSGREGGTLRVPAGRYGALCLNSDTESVRYRNTELSETFEVYTRDAALLESLGFATAGIPRAEGTEDERVCYAPDPLWTDRSENVELQAADPMQTLTLYLARSVTACTVEIRHAENLQYVIGVSGSLSGLAGGLLPGADALTAERVTVPFGVSVGGDGTTLTGGLLTFGHCPGTPGRHFLTIYAVLSDRSKWYYTYDVTEEVHTAPDPRNIYILLDGLPIPRPIEGGGGLLPDVDEWQPIDVEIEM